MCIGPFAPKPPKMLALPDLGASNRAATDEVSTPVEGRDAKTKDDLARVNLGANKKQSGPSGSKKTGTNALSIGGYLNTGNVAQGNNTTGLNV